MNLTPYYLRMIKNYDYDTYLHCVRVAVLTNEIGNIEGLNSVELKQLSISALLHDVGKIRVPKSILIKPGKLNAMEWVEMINHPAYGVEILKNAEQPFAEEIIESIHCHHEFYNGEGYPRGIKKDEIPLYARIITIADSIDAMIVKRPYHQKALSLENAIKEVIENTGTQFDPNVAEKISNINLNITKSLGITNSAFFV